ncbi:MAG: IS5 family transposase [Deltaproteobacteria bacterium]|nr:IS5 family transposase [Deltaproteobacteria bacterium]
MIILREHHTALFTTRNLLDELDPTNRLVILAKNLDWATIEENLSIYYDSTGTPGLPIRLMAGLNILKYIEDESDEKIIQNWKENPYYQAFTGSDCFSKDLPPCNSSSLSIFRRRIGVDGCNFLLKQSILLNKIDLNDQKEVIIDSTVQPKYTAFPTDIKLTYDVIKSLWALAIFYGIKFRNKYKKETKRLRKNAAFDKSKNRGNIREETLARLRKIASILLKEIEAKLPDNIKSTASFELTYDTYNKVITQKKDDKNKIYSIYEPQIYCIAKGKTNVKYEYGTKVVIIVDKKTGIVLEVNSLDENTHDSKTIKPILDHLQEHTGIKPIKVIGDKGYRGPKVVNNATIIVPEKDISKLDDATKKEKINDYNRRSVIEQVISHCKNEYKLGRNVLKGIIGDKINPILTSIAYNCQLFIRSTIKQINKVKSNKRKNILSRNNYKKVNDINPRPIFNAYYEPKQQLK